MNGVAGGGELSYRFQIAIIGDEILTKKRKFWSKIFLECLLKRVTE